MGQDHVFLDMIQAEVPLGVGHGPTGVVGAVEGAAFFLNVPVLEKVVLEQRTPDQGTGIGPQMQQPRQP